MGNHTVIRTNGLNGTGGGNTTIFSSQQDDSPDFNYTVRGPAHQSGDGPSSFNTSISGNQSIAYSGFGRGNNLQTHGTRTISTSTVTTQTNTNIPTTGAVSLDTFNVPGTFSG